MPPPAEISPLQNAPPRILSIQIPELARKEHQGTQIMTAEVLSADEIDPTSFLCVVYLLCTLSFIVCSKSFFYFAASVSETEFSLVLLLLLLLLLLLRVRSCIVIGSLTISRRCASYTIDHSTVILWTNAFERFTKKSTNTSRNPPRVLEKRTKGKASYGS